MTNQFKDIYAQVARQLGHWSQAASRLSKLEELAPASAWKGLEHYLNITLRRTLQQSLARLKQNGLLLERQLNAARTLEDLTHIQGQVDLYKKTYLRTETMLDFYADAINSRTNDDMASLLRACDKIAYKSMDMVLKPLGKKTPPVLTYVDKGLGASILKAGLRLWDGKTQSPAAAIKVVRHNLYRPTALIHEAGHQIAHILGWNEELAKLLHRRLAPISEDLAELWSGWASEIAADTFAFAHTGYAAMTGLCDVLSGSNKFVFHYQSYDPHPISYLRLLLGTAMCSGYFGEGPWDQMERVWKQKYDLNEASSEVRGYIEQSLPLLKMIAHCCLQAPMKAFGNRTITYWVNPQKVAPQHLLELKNTAGRSMYSSGHWVSKEAIRLLAMGGYEIAMAPDQVPNLLQKQREWMLALGNIAKAA